MTMWHFSKQALRIAAIPALLYLALVVLVFFRQRSMLYFPSHRVSSSNLAPWLDGKRVIGYCREAPNARTVWLMTHGNAGQAADRDYVLSRMSDQDSLYVLEYPGYGVREGTPCRESMTEAAIEAYRKLRSQFPNTPVCSLGESIGTGAACALALEKTPPDKIVLVVPFDSIANVAAERFWFLPVRVILRERWDNVEALKHYSGPIDVFGATGDTIIPISHAQNLARQIPNAHFTAIACGHNDWSFCDQVKIAR